MTPPSNKAVKKPKNPEPQSPRSTALVPTPKNLPSVVPSADKTALGRYLQEISRFPLLTPNEELELAKQSFDQKDPVAAQKLVQANLRFVVKIAFEYARYGARVLDLIQEGNVGLLRAVRDFNPYKDVRLTTYAVYWIRSYIQDYLLKNWSLVRVGTTAAQKKLFYNLKKTQERLEREGVSHNPKAIAMHLGVDESDVKLMSERLSGGDVSLSAPVGPDRENSPITLTQRIQDASPLASAQLEATEQAVLFRQALDEFVRELDDREKVIFQQRLLADTPRTLVEIGEEYGVSKERARQIEERIKKKLKDFLAQYYPDISVN